VCGLVFAVEFNGMNPKKFQGEIGCINLLIF